MKLDEISKARRAQAALYEGRAPDKSDGKCLAVWIAELQAELTDLADRLNDLRSWKQFVCDVVREDITPADLKDGWDA